MKVENTAIFMGDTTKMQRQQGIAGGMSENEQKKGGNTIFAGDINLKIDPIARRKEEARQEALKIVKDAWEGDREIDDDLTRRRNRVSELQNEMGEIKDRLKELEDMGEIASEDSKEDYERQLAAIEDEIRTENATIRTIKGERLKYHTMVDAQNQADEVLEASSKEVIGMLMEEAKDHVDEKLEEEKEAAEEKAEEQEKLEEQIQSVKDKKEEQEELTKEIVKLTEEMTELGSMKLDVQEEIQKMLDKMKLLEEDVKGAVVDKTK